MLRRVVAALPFLRAVHDPGEVLWHQVVLRPNCPELVRSEQEPPSGGALVLHGVAAVDQVLLLPEAPPFF
jgi:hypothetical protein